MSEHRQLHGYRILSKLGTGAHSNVYEAEDEKGNRFALKKTIAEDASAMGALRQAVTEHEVSQKLDHFGLRKTFKLIRPGLLSFGKRNWVVEIMELVNGVTLEEVPNGQDLRGKRLLAVCNWMILACNALHSMHQKGFVHSDIKPQNVLLTPEGRVKIIDFGQTCTINTIKKRIQGTPDFMAPEQTRAEKITVRTDVFCLGSTMYSILTGEPLPTGTGAHFARMGTRRRSGLPAPHELNPHLPVSLSRLVLDSVQDDPEKRPESMRAVSKRLKLVCHMLTQALNGPT